jgi:hypothetical protein
VLKDDGSLWATGHNTFGSVGDGTNAHKFSFVKVIDGGVADVAGGRYHTMALKTDGSLWGTGYNIRGGLGDGTTTHRNKFVQVVDGLVMDVSAGEDYTIALQADGSVWATGYNLHGQHGDGTTSQKTKFAKVVDTGVKAVATGVHHTQLLKTDGSVWAAGLNNYGQLGDGTKTQSKKFVKVVDGGVKEVRAGHDFSILLTDKHELCVTGYNVYGMLGTGDKTDVLGFDKKCFPRPGPCAANNGGCHSARTCIADNKGSVSCGDCSTAFVNDGPKGCKCEGGLRVKGTMYGSHVKTDPNRVGYTGCQAGLNILVTYNAPFYKMVGVKLEDAKASSTPPGIAKYVEAAKGSISLNKDTVCKMFKGEGYTSKGGHIYKLKDATVSCYPPPSPCAINGCHSKRTCTVEAGSAKCGDCPAPALLNDGPKGCKEGCKWTRKHSHYVVQGHVDGCPKSGTSSDLFADLEDAKAACLKAGDCLAVTKQNRPGDICHAKWRVVHAPKPEWKFISGGINSFAMDAYEATPECLSPCVTNNGGCHGARKCMSTTGGSVTCADCRTGYTNDGAKGCKATCKFAWTKKDSFFATVGHDKCPASDVFADLEDAKKACIDAGDCKVISTQKNLCDGKYRVVHSLEPGLKEFTNGINSHNMRAYEAKSDCDCVFCERQPPISFVIDRSGSMKYCLGVRPVKECPVGSRRFDKVTSEVIKMLETLPDGTLFSLRAFSESTYPFSNDEFVKNSAAMRKTLQNWFDANGPHKGTYMSLALKMLIRKKDTAKTLYLLADGETDQHETGQHSLYSIASGAGVKIHVVGVDLKPSDGGYKNLHEIAKRTGGTEKFI